MDQGNCCIVMRGLCMQSRYITTVQVDATHMKTCVLLYIMHEVLKFVQYSLIGKSLDVQNIYLHFLIFLIELNVVVIFSIYLSGNRTNIVQVNSLRVVMRDIFIGRGRLEIKWFAVVGKRSC